MSDKHELNISISETGEVQIEVSGVKGSKCLSLTEDIEKELGVVLLREKKSEYYQQETGSTIVTDIKR
jgi:hypothetical protein